MASSDIHGRCGHPVEIDFRAEHVDRVYCPTCDEYQALWREDERI